MTESVTETTTQSGPGATAPALPAQPLATPSGATRADGGPGPLDGPEAAVILEQARAMVDPELRSAVDALPRAMRRVARYHFGWEHADGTPRPATPARRSGRRSSSPRRPRSAVPGRRRVPCGRPRRWSWCTTSRCCTTT
ncbi:hypothetical protein GCM10020295_26660 [Streptomyces cinereospinus]